MTRYLKDTSATRTTDLEAEPAHEVWKYLIVFLVEATSIPVSDCVMPAID